VTRIGSGNRQLSRRAPWFLGLGYPALYAFGMLSKPDFAPAAIWPADGLTFCAFVLLPVRTWPLVALGMTAWELVLIPVIGALSVPPWLSLGATLCFAAANVLTVAVPAALVRHWHLLDESRSLKPPISPRWIGALFVGVLPGSLAGVWAHAFAAGTSVVLTDAWIWALSTVLSIATFAPAAFGLVQGFSDPAPAPATAAEGWCVAAVIAGLFVWVAGTEWLQSDAITGTMLFALPLSWLALRFSRRATGVTVAIVAAGITFLAGHGAFGQAHSADPGAWRAVMTSLDVLLLTCCGGALLVNLMTLNQRGLTADLARQHDALKATESNLRSIVYAMPVLMDAYDEHGNIVAWNGECERVTGYAASEIIANPRAMELLYPDAEYRSLMLDEAALRRSESYSSVWELVAKDGTVKTIEWFNVGARVTIPGWLEWSIGIDITDRRRLEASLREATFHEQRRLGRELHDGLGQELTGLSMLASALARSRATDDPALAAELAQLALIASQAIVTCKNIARGLAPITDPDDGLAEALRTLTEALAAQTREVTVTYHFGSTAALMIPLETSNHLYRIAQEAMNNALKHGAPRSVRVALDIEIERVCLEVHDDGAGMVAAAARDSGLGLQSMRDRAAAIGATLTMVTSETGGTTIRCECPNVDPEPQRRQS